MGTALPALDVPRRLLGHRLRGTMSEPTEQEREFDADTAAIRRAREFAVAAAGADAAPQQRTELAERLALVVSELASNAVLHAGTPFTVRVWRGPDRVRVEVMDRSDRLPAPRDHDPTAVSGRGLAIVGTLADRWGVEVVSGGKCVWAELPVQVVPTS
jgi:anti-sigma regulatory factor (Ser/Thr protein kinase)